MKKEPNPDHGIWFGRKLFLHLLRKLRRNKPWLIADLTPEQRVIFLSCRRVK